MKTYSFFTKIITATFLSFALLACSEDDAGRVLQRESDNMSFSYIESSKDLSILSSGKWDVTSKESWITFSPETGTQADERVKITVSQNKKESREGVVYLADGVVSLEIKVSQDAGIFSWGAARVTGSMMMNQASTAQLTISYNKGAADDLANVSAIINGLGASGLSISPVTGHKLSTGEGTITLNIEGTPTSAGEVILTVDVDLTSRGIATQLEAKGRVKSSASEIAPLPSPTITMYKLLPRMAVVDWGEYVKGSGESRKFTLEIAETQFGGALRHYSSVVDWLDSASIGTGNYFFKYNRFVWADLQPATTYWFRIIHHSNNLTENIDSDIGYLQFTTPSEPVETGVVLYKDFDNFWWGGSPIYHAFGVMPIEGLIKVNLDPNSDIVRATDYRTNLPVSNIALPFTTTGALGTTNCPAMWNYYWDGATYGTNLLDPGYKGWHGVNCHPNSTSVRLSIGGATGWIRTPKLESLGSTPTAITVITNTAPYFEPYHGWGEDNTDHLIKVEGDGVIVSGGLSLVGIDATGKIATVRSNKNTNPIDNGLIDGHTHVETTEHTIKVTGATENTQITISALPYGSGENGRVRLFVDDIKIKKE